MRAERSMARVGSVVATGNGAAAIQTHSDTVSQPEPTIGGNILRAMQKASISGAHELATRTLVAEAYLRLVISNDRVPPLAVLQRIASATNTTLAELLAGIQLRVL